MASNNEENLELSSTVEPKSDQDRIKILIENRTDDIAELIKQHANKLCDQIREKQIIILSQAEQYENEMKIKLEKMFNSYSEALNKQNKYKNYLDNEPDLDENDERKVQAKVEKYTKEVTWFKKQLNDFDFCYKFKPTDFIDDLSSIGELSLSVEIYNEDDYQRQQQQGTNNESTINATSNTTTNSKEITTNNADLSSSSSKANTENNDSKTKGNL